MLLASGRAYAQAGQTGFFLFTELQILRIFLAEVRQLCYIIFTGKDGHINFKMKITYF